MGVDVDAKLKYGYKVQCEDIPDFEKRMDYEFNDLADEPDGYKVTILGEEFWCDGLVDGDNAYVSYEKQDWYIGVDLPDEGEPEDIVRACNESEELVKRMYELVMRKPPTEKPKIHLYARWW